MVLDCPAEVPKKAFWLPVLLGLVPAPIPANKLFDPATLNTDERFRSRRDVTCCDDCPNPPIPERTKTELAT